VQNVSERVWEKYLSERDRAVYKAAGYGGRIGVGIRPALLIIDVQYSFTGDEPQPILEAVKQYRTACGEEGWKAVGHIKRLLEACRTKNIPTFYTVSERRKDYFDSGVQRHKNFRHHEKSGVAGTRGTQIVEEIAPIERDIIISKRKPSAFFGTPLMSYLNQLDVDTLLITGSTTSGCIRATVLDAYSYNFRTVVVEECTFDRFELSHAANLFDMDTKYADVMSIEEVLEYVNGLPARKEVLA